MYSYIASAKIAKNLFVTEIKENTNHQSYFPMFLMFHLEKVVHHLIYNHMV